jgi:hypothetical protein
MAAATGAMTDEQLRSAFADGPLGVIVTHTESRGMVEELLGEAARLGIEIAVFFNDEGVRLMADRDWIDSLPEGHYSACDLNASSRGIEAGEKVNVAGQFHNAMMVCDASRVVSL